jgi:putative transposase
MARQARLQVPGLAHHVVQRGHNGAVIFIDDDDRHHYLTSLLNVSREHGVDVHAYALLPDRVLLLARPQSATGLSQLMQGLGRRYVPWFNQRHSRTGTLWEGRFRACVLEPGEWVLRCQRFIECPAADAELAPGLLANPWSSAVHHLGERRDPLITDAVEHWRLGNTPFEREAAYRLLWEQGLSSDDSRLMADALRSGRPLGGEAFLSQLAQAHGWSGPARCRGRPRKAAA